ncbi:hypothetical protein Vafri_16021 [Volvox africanus]|uniref:Uncharacterized protein n=1 Tax=Volvox africanus TaxID=51714 RepID=A0A8J4F8F8_9CHLO|nr:hypothetical protein Vafri_16021 [Volvox africanus]
MTVMQPPSTAPTNANGSTTAATTTTTTTTSQVSSKPQCQSQPQSLRGRSTTRCVGRQIFSLQEGLLRVSSASTVSAGGCCEEVDLAQHALVLPVLAEALVAMGAMDDPGDMGVAHGSVIHALAQLWSHMADVLSDQTLGTASHAGRALRAAAAAMEPPSLTRGVLKGLWDKVLAVGRWHQSVGGRVIRWAVPGAYM